MFRIKYCREITLKILYEVDLLCIDDMDAHQLLQLNTDFFKGLNSQERNFITKIIQKILDEKQLIDQRLSANLIGWKLERLLSVDRSLLRLGVGESFFNDQKAIIIDDVVRMAKKYGSEESYKIINAILDKVIE
ncbi:MAG: transcription antitermination protein NusB [Candidatus Omnitrophota bacterium]